MWRQSQALVACALGSLAKREEVAQGLARLSGLAPMPGLAAGHAPPARGSKPGSASRVPAKKPPAALTRR